jgi:5-methylcytosine-specific restriction protein A
MAKEFSKKLYASKAWRECRDGFIKSVFGLCKNFNKCHRPGVIVHHTERLTPENINDPDVTLNWNKLEYLCIECHNAVDSDKDVVRDDVVFDESGNLVKR